MSKSEKTDLTRFMKIYSREINDLVFWLRDFAWDLYPDANELIYDNYNALAVGWSTSDKVGDTFCSIAVGRTTRNVHFGFYWGAKIQDPEKILLGNGSQYRYILVTDKSSFPRKYITKLIHEAHAYSMAKMKVVAGMPEGTTITKSVSAAKRTKKASVKGKTTAKIKSVKAVKKKK